MIPETIHATYCRTGTVALLCLALIVIILAVYMQVGNHEFLNLDDDTYVTNNPHLASGITVNNIIWAFTSVEAANWHPITWLSHMTDVQIFGMNPRGHHFTNVAIHAVSALLLFLLLLRLTGAIWQSLLVAALFALHPLHVESVAWVAERKDVLSAFFWFITLLFYAKYVTKLKPALYVLALFFFVLGLMSKPMLVTLPIVMLLLDFWPLDRYRGVNRQGLHQLLGRLVALTKEKIPFFACSLLSGVITIYAQQEGGAVQGLSEISFQLRSENALIAYVKYIGKTLWPQDLAVLYPFPLSVPLWQVIGSLFILFLLSAAAIRAGRRYPYFAIGWFWFLITLLPVIGLIQVGGQSMADRYSYIPVIGLFIMAAWGVADLTKGLRHRQVLLTLLACTVVIVAATLTWRQLGYWQDSISLYRHTLRVTSGSSSSIYYNLGLALQNKGYQNEAIQEYQAAIRVNPDHMKAHNNLGNAFTSKGDLDAAIQEYQEALRINPNHTTARNNLELVLARKRMHGE